jgi:hypothetical protein
VDGYHRTGSGEGRHAASGQNIAILGKFRLLAGVHHVVDKLLHRRLLDTVKVVADAHIENKRLASSSA